MGKKVGAYSPETMVFVIVCALCGTANGFLGSPYLDDFLHFYWSGFSDNAVHAKTTIGLKHRYRFSSLKDSTSYL